MVVVQPGLIGYRYILWNGKTLLEFDVESCMRPVWLSDFPERFCAPEADFMALACELLQASRIGGMRLVSLNTPVATSVQKYAKLSLSAHFVTPDYELPDGVVLYEKMPPLWIADTFELKEHHRLSRLKDQARKAKWVPRPPFATAFFPYRMEHGTETILAWALPPQPLTRFPTPKFGVPMNLLNVLHPMGMSSHEL